MVQFARRITQTSKKGFGMYEKAAGLAADGRDLIHLELGMPCHDTPQHIKEATIQAIRDGKVHYSDIRGILPLRKALTAKLAEHNGLHVSPEEILVTNGLTQASFAAFMALLDEGDEVILLEPFYPQHVGKIELAGAKVVRAPLDREAGFRIRASLIEPKITSRTRMIVLVNPSNPTGRVYSREELEEIARLAIKHDLVVVSDEVYDQIVFDGAPHISIASLPGMRERTISLFAFTKAYAMDGWRLGYLVADAAIVNAAMKIHMNEVTHVNTFIQDGALAAVLGAASILREMVDDDRTKRDFVVQRLNQMPGVACRMPEGTIYAFPDISGSGLHAQEAADRILEEVGVVVEAGSFYGELGNSHLRVCFGSQPMERLEEAMNRLGRFFNTL
ncbi:pyridoxal phosphate-dependent aminotransferase [Mesorhizobium sp. DCY119]|uniref:pyridoxal phosphate-dependent aminotransferase n=1 Tax=Mesorhizobium sp. DCY119 TaxID=2108445 RepID=UPI000E70E79F|nr:pyridoxal phosphate-dependent aminotransferase [Mesorhizobium sp. DCY119]RJG40484.1 pyridoxal phosphate-dependent aminotransferase [Mesorhizobium sp. DCY119]